MLNNQVPEMIMLMGVPGSGKSTYIKSVLNSGKDYVIISTDDLLQEEIIRTGNSYAEVHKAFFKAAEKQMKANFAAALLNGQNIIWDQTNWTAKRRKAILGRMPNYFKKGVFFNISLDLAKERVLKRELETGKHIPMNILEDMHRLFEVPTISEGFNIIEIVE